MNINIMLTSSHQNHTGTETVVHLKLFIYFILNLEKYGEVSKIKLQR